MTRRIATDFRVARTPKECTGCQLVLKRTSEADLSFTQKATMLKAQAAGYHIQPGQLYRREAWSSDGSACCLNYIPEVYDICVDLDLFDED